MGFFDSFDLVDLVDKDPNVERGVNRSADTGEELTTQGRAQLQLAKDQAAKYDPRFTDALDRQNAITKDQQGRSNEQWDRYKQQFAPVEDKMVSDAMNFDSPAALERAAQTAGADVTKSYGLSRDITQRNLTRSGLNPGSAAYMRGTSNLGLEEASARAGAETNARAATRTQGMALRTDAANFGRGVASGANASDQLALAGAQGGVTSANTAMQAPITAQNSALPWYTGANTAFGTSGGLAEQNFGERLGVGKSLLSDATSSAGYAMSSKDVKTDKESVDGERVLEGLEQIPVEKWKYKKGVEDGGTHVGPYAEDVRRKFGDRAAPGGEGLDLVTMNGIALKGIQTLAKKVKALEEGSGKKIARSTEPTSTARTYDSGDSGGGLEPRGGGAYRGPNVMAETFGLTPMGA